MIHPIPWREGKLAPSFVGTLSDLAEPTGEDFRMGSTSSIPTRIGP